jgi:hypothetical protein
VAFLFWGRNKGCEHKYTAYLDENNNQYCINCGLAHHIEIKCQHSWEFNAETEMKVCLKCGEIERLPCKHIWEKTHQYTNSQTNPYGGKKEWDSFIYHCKNCGEVKTKDLG